MLERLVFVDCEASGPAPGIPGNELTEFGAVHYTTRQQFYGRLWNATPVDNAAPQLLEPQFEVHWTYEGELLPVVTVVSAQGVFFQFRYWLRGILGLQRPTFISDNLAFDWQWINHGFHLHLGENPFGFSGRRINDFYAGLGGDFQDQNTWKKLRITTHDHNPVNDALGNVEAFERILRGER